MSTQPDTTAKAPVETPSSATIATPVADKVAVAPVAAAPVAAAPAPAAPVAAKPAPVPVAPAPVAIAPAKPAADVAAPVKRGRGRPRKVPGAAAKPAATKPAAKVATKAPAASAKPKITAKYPVNPIVKRAAAPKAPVIKKEIPVMATKSNTPEFAAKIQDTFKDAAEKAKAAFGDTGEFAKGNLEAVVESTKILASGMKSMGETYVTETKSAYETMTADLKSLTAVKSPTEFFELQSKLFKKNFDAAVATGSKKSEAVLKLANEAFQPISTRVSLAMEKVKKAA